LDTASLYRFAFMRTGMSLHSGALIFFVQAEGRKAAAFRSVDLSACMVAVAGFAPAFSGTMKPVRFWTSPHRSVEADLPAVCWRLSKETEHTVHGTAFVSSLSLLRASGHGALRMKGRSARR